MQFHFEAQVLHDVGSSGFTEHVDLQKKLCPENQILIHFASRHFETSCIIQMVKP